MVGRAGLCEAVDEAGRAGQPSARAGPAHTPRHARHRRSPPRPAQRHPAQRKLPALRLPLLTRWPPPWAPPGRRSGATTHPGTAPQRRPAGPQSEWPPGVNEGASKQQRRCKFGGGHGMWMGSSASEAKGASSGASPAWPQARPTARSGRAAAPAHLVARHPGERHRAEGVCCALRLQGPGVRAGGHDPIKAVCRCVRVGVCAGVRAGPQRRKRLPPTTSKHTLTSPSRKQGLAQQAPLRSNRCTTQESRAAPSSDSIACEPTCVVQRVAHHLILLHRHARLRHLLTQMLRRAGRVGGGG